MNVVALTEERGALVGIGGPAARHEVDESLSAWDGGRQAVESGVRPRATQDAEHYLHGVRGLCPTKTEHKTQQTAAAEKEVKL